MRYGAHLFLCSLGFLSVQAANLPPNLTGPEVGRTVEILGLGSTNRSLLTAESLGMEPGIRVGMVQTMLVTHDLKKMGSQSASMPEVVPVPSIHIAKGLPLDWDVEFVFMPPQVLSYVEKYGASFGWNFLPERNYPVAVSIRPHFSYAEMFSGDFSTWNYGVNATVSRDFVWWSPYAQVGYAMAQGCVRKSLAGGSQNCSVQPGGTAAIGVKFNVALTFVAEIATHNLDPSISIFVGKDF